MNTKCLNLISYVTTSCNRLSHTLECFRQHNNTGSIPLLFNIMEHYCYSNVLLAFNEVLYSSDGSCQYDD